MAWPIEDPGKAHGAQRPLHEQSTCSPVYVRQPYEWSTDTSDHTVSSSSLAASQYSPVANNDSFAAIWNAGQHAAQADFCHLQLDDPYLTSPTSAQGSFTSPEYQLFLEPVDPKCCHRDSTSEEERGLSAMADRPSFPLAPFPPVGTISSRNEVSGSLLQESPRWILMHQRSRGARRKTALLKEPFGCVSNRP
jgi:hypothetical protein